MELCVELFVGSKIVSVGGLWLGGEETEAQGPTTRGVPGAVHSDGFTCVLQRDVKRLCKCKQVWWALNPMTGIIWKEGRFGQRCRHGEEGHVHREGGGDWGDAAGSRWGGCLGLPRAGRVQEGTFSRPSGGSIALLGPWFHIPCPQN